jgi:hypothetical protein
VLTLTGPVDPSFGPRYVRWGQNSVDLHSAKR